jgi:hypothetical protein
MQSRLFHTAKKYIASSSKVRRSILYVHACDPTSLQISLLFILRILIFFTHDRFLPQVVHTNLSD